MKPPSRNPSEYHPCTHLLQRIRYRKNPAIKFTHVTDAIREGVYAEVGEKAQFKHATRIAGTPHEITVGIAPENMVAITCFCYCHRGDMDCRPHRFTDSI